MIEITFPVVFRTIYNCTTAQLISDGDTGTAHILTDITTTTIQGWVGGNSWSKIFYIAIGIF